MDSHLTQPSSSSRQTPETTNTTLSVSKRGRTRSLQKEAPIMEKAILATTAPETIQPPPAPKAVTIGGLFDSHNVDYTEMQKEMLDEGIIANSINERSLNIKAPKRRILEKLDDDLDRSRDFHGYPSTSASCYKFVRLENENGGNAIPETIPNTSSNVETSEGILSNKSEVNECQNECANSPWPTSIDNYKYSYFPSMLPPPLPHAETIGGLFDPRRVNYTEIPSRMLNEDVIANSVVESSSTSASISNFTSSEYGGHAIPVTISNAQNNFETFEGIPMNKFELNESQNERVVDIPSSTLIHNSKPFNYDGTYVLQRQESTTTIKRVVHSTSTITSITSTLPSLEFHKFGGPLIRHCGNEVHDFDENHHASSLNRPAHCTSHNACLPVIQDVRTDTEYHNICEMATTSVENGELFANGMEGVPMNSPDGDEDGRAYVHHLNLNHEEEEYESQMGMASDEDDMAYVHHLNLDHEEEEYESQMGMERGEDNMAYMQSLNFDPEEDELESERSRRMFTALQDFNLQSIRTAIHNHFQQNGNADPVDFYSGSTLCISSENLSDAGSDSSVEFVNEYVLDANDEADNIPSTSRGRLHKPRMDKALHTSEHAEKNQELHKEESLADSPKPEKRLTDCAVCLEPLSKIEDVSSTACGHIFCTPCINSAISLHGNCPVCRTDLDEKKVHPVFLF